MNWNSDGAGESMNKINLVVTGLRFGSHIVNELLKKPHPGMCLYGVCDIDEKRLNTISSKHGLRSYKSLDDVLADPEVHAVGLYTGPTGRAELLRKIIRSGRDVMTTKPFETDPDAALSVMEEAGENGRIIHLNSPAPRLSDDLSLIRKWESEFELGRPIAAYASAYASYREVADGTWYDDPELCPVAPILRLGIYLINDLVRILGKGESVNVMESRIFTGRPTSDNASIAIKFKNNALATVFSSFCIDDGNRYRNQLMVHYEKGTVLRNVDTETRTGYETEMKVIKSLDEGMEVVDSATITDVSGLYDWDTFAAAINCERDVPIYNMDDVIEPLRIIEAIKKSAKTNIAVTCR
jgi:predicted dehydrogenase